MISLFLFFFFFSSRRRHTRSLCDWSSDVCSSDLTDFVDEAPLETKEFQVLYRDQGGVHVMDTTTYEQHTLDAEAVGDHADWLQPEMHIQVEWLNGRPVGIELPSVVELTVVQTSPVMRSATKTASTKPAKLSNGVTIQVPEFISEGEKVRVDPREGAYLERAK